MRIVAFIALAGALTPVWAATDKLTIDDKIELMRGLTAEYANAKVLLPRSKKNLEFNADTGTWDKKEWSAIAKEYGPAARTGDTIQITKIELFDDHIVLQINKGFQGGRRWYDGVQVDNGAGAMPVSNNNDVNAPGGTSIVVTFHKPLAGMKAAEVKKLMAPVLDFDRHSVTEIYSETLPPEMKQAIRDKHALVGMDRDQVKMALGTPVHKEREVKDGAELEDWVYGTTPGKIVFVTFDGSKVVKVKEEYAGLGTDVGEVKK